MTSHQVGDYLNAYAGRRFWIVGKGPTRFDFENLCEIDDPVIFLNDAVQLERFAAGAPETFFFAHDPHQRVWLTGELRSTAILPERHATGSTGRPKLSVQSASPEAATVASVATYTWAQEYRRDPARVARLSRSEIARTGRLFVGPGTIHTAIHFAWLCGASGVSFIGCDGWPGHNSTDPATAYDPRIELRSGAPSLGVHVRIRKTQDWLCGQLALATDYVHEPHATPQIPRTAHFIWLGGAPPPFATDHLAAFRRHNPDWEVRLWTAPPAGMPAELRTIYDACDLLCQQADVLRYWLLHRYGGVYLDCDVLTLRSFEPLRRHEAFAARQCDGRVNIAVLGSVAGGVAMDVLLRAVREAVRTDGAKRTKYGPALLTNLFGDSGRTHHLSVLPEHYFYLFRWHRDSARNEAHRFRHADTSERQRMLAAVDERITDPVAPYAVHLWGVDGSSHRKVNE